MKIFQYKDLSFKRTQLLSVFIQKEVNVSSFGRKPLTAKQLKPWSVATLHFIRSLDLSTNFVYRFPGST
jgi:hypothetical protein